MSGPCIEQVMPHLAHFRHLFDIMYRLSSSSLRSSGSLLPDRAACGYELDGPAAQPAELSTLAQASNPS